MTTNKQKFQFAIRTNAKRKCTMEEALAICIRANVAVCKRYLHRIGPLDCDDLDLLQSTALPSALRTLDTHLIFEGVEFNRHVKAFEGKNNNGYKLPRETFASKKVYPIQRIAYDKDDDNINEFLAEFLMNALFIRLTGSTKYLMNLIKDKGSTLPGMNINEWRFIFDDLEAKTTSAPYINSQWTSKFSKLRDSIRSFMVDMHEQLMDNDNIKSLFASRVSVFTLLNDILDNEFVTSLIIGDIEDFFSGIFDEIPLSTVKSGYGGGDGKTVIEIIGDYIPYSSCLWSWRPAKTSGYGSHQDSTMLSSKKGKHYQEIVVTLVFHFDCSGESGAYLEITESGSDKIIKKFETLDLSSHVQHPGNQKNLFHSITSISSGSGGSRLVMTARRTGVPKPTTVIKDYFKGKYPATHESELQERRKYQHQSHTLREILSLHETNDLFQLFSNSQTSSTTTASIQHRRKRNTCQISSPKLSAPISKKQKGNSAKSSNIHTDIENSDGDIESDNDCDHSNVLTSIDTSNFYSYQPETNKKSNQATFIAHPASGIDFFLHEKSLSILFQKKIFIETVSAKSDLRITWSPMFHKNGLPVNIGDTININTYKTHHNIRESDIGGFISSNDIDTCTGYCLLHPERTLGYNEIMDLAANGKAQNFTFFGSGGAANVKGSNPSSISSVTCSAGGIFPRNQHFHSKTNECLNELSELERPIHFAMLVKDEKSGKKTEDVRYLGMYTIAGVTFGFPDIMGERMTRKNCDNIHGASFRKAKVFSYKAEPFDMGGLNNLGKYSEWKSITLDPNNVPYSFGILVQNITAGNVLRADCDEYDCNDVFEAMRTAPIGEIFDAQSVCEQIDRGDNSSN
ncbi:predicted protein [Chaetoceros tenuissimus]|uniref:Uncharacterized protein n=1 Tax=Chaetoceros tenuissimus TaxID=426638 RepID=A0AAD3CXG1_9STRA|nr:predicted protein [Chaetoceros tenuissimus]